MEAWCPRCKKKQNLCENLVIDNKKYEDRTVKITTKDYSCCMCDTYIKKERIQESFPKGSRRQSI